MLSLRELKCLVAVTFVGAAVFAGCSSQNVSQPVTGPTSSSDWKAGLDEDVVLALSQLSETERTAALAQKVCPVSDELLGSMGKPPKITVEGQEVFLCCDGCDDQIRKEPATYLEKLNQKN